jgi:hypothetical protein
VEGDVKFMKHLKRGARYKHLGTSAIRDEIFSGFLDTTFV